MQRRDFLRGCLASSGLLLPSVGRAGTDPWGGPPDSVAAGLLLPQGVRAERVLDLFLYGGLAPFETFYSVDSYGDSSSDYPGEQLHLFEDDLPTVLSTCGIDLPQDQWIEPFGVDSAGVSVGLGPLVKALRDRPDVVARTRVLVHRHTLEPHEAAIPYALSGHRLGSARLCGLGASVQRYFRERDTTGRTVPWSTVLYPDTDLVTENLQAASAVGFHPGSARPLPLRLTEQSDLPAWLARDILGDRRDAYDRLVAYYADQARQRYTLQGQQLRAPALDDLAFSTTVMRDADALRAVFSDDVLAPLDGSACGTDAFSTIATGLRLATHLLTHPTAPARHVTLVDGGLVPASGGGGYDVHSRHLEDTARNLHHTLTELCARINEPGEGDADKLDLDDTMIVLNTEFGRTPYRQAGSSDGTNHHPYGYVVVLIGGPIGPDQQGVLGAIGPDAMADRYLTPVESRAAVLAAMGIYPFHHEAFAVGDLRELADERDGLAWLNQVVLGVPA